MNLITVAVVTMCVGLVYGQSPSCFTPDDGMSGECIDISQCEPILTLANKPMKTDREFRPLLKSGCGVPEGVQKVSYPKRLETEPVHSINGSCTTPDGRPGTCIGLHSCRHIENLLIPPVTQQNIDFVRKSKCNGPEQYPVCCGPHPEEVQTGGCTRTTAFPPHRSSKCCVESAGFGNNISGTASSRHVSQRQHHTAIDAFVQRLKLETWEKEEAPCLEKTLTLLENVKNFTLWATWVWNANTVPTGNLYGSWGNVGNFDQCMKPPWLETHPQFRTKYCMAKLELSDNPKRKAEYDPYGSTVDYLNSPTTSGLPVNEVFWGICVPAACLPLSIVKITRSMYDLTTFGSEAPNITVDHCQVAGDELLPGVGFYLFIALIVSLIVIAAASTYYRIHISSDDQPPDSLETIITKSFCIIKNRQDLVKNNKEEIRVMNGMRFLTAASVIVVHEVFYSSLTGFVNNRDFDKFMEGGLFLHIDVVVDTFFAMSGLLHIKGLLGNANRQQNLFSVLWKRYVRLMGPYVIIIFYLISVSKYIGSGPIWIFGNEQESEVCLKTWRMSFLMLNTDLKYICHVVAWYVPCDYQLTILGTALFYFYQKDRRVGFAAFGTATVLSLIIPGALTYWYQLPAFHFMHFGKLQREMRDYWELSYTYTPSYSRAGAYLVGVTMGYLMTLYKPSEYRKIVSKTWSIIGTAVSLATMLCIFLLGKFLMYREYSPIEAAVITSTNRIAWAVAICVIIGLCEYGTVPVVTDILSFSYFTPLSRLSYGIYMIHPLLIQRNKIALRSLLKFDTFSVGLDTIGTLTTATGLSFAMWLLVEAPLTNISNNFLFRKSKSTPPIKEPEKNGIQHQNGDIKTKSD